MTQKLKASPYRLQMKWSDHLKDKAAKQKFEEDVHHYLAQPIFTRLRQILNQEKETLTRETDYDNPSWAHKQAHINGRLDEIDRILLLIGNFK